MERNIHDDASRVRRTINHRVLLRLIERTRLFRTIAIRELYVRNPFALREKRAIARFRLEFVRTPDNIFSPQFPFVILNFQLFSPMKFIRHISFIYIS